MTQEQKDLLIKDLSARLHYGVKCKYYDCCEGDYDEGVICGFERQEWMQINGKCIHIEEVKPYLFPLSSMSEEQLYNNPIGFSQMLTIKADRDWENITINRRSYYKLVDWFNKNHFDYRGLIPMGLAKDATGLNIYFY